jgi:urea transporter/murein DD-endopeptidase MepM/ murein hydrolase activator NlpD
MVKEDGYIKPFIESVFYSYTQIFFSKNLIFGILLLITTFFDINVGISGLLAVLFTNAIALILGFDKRYIIDGSYGFNSLLVGLGLGLYYQFSFPFLILLLIASLLTFIITIVISGILSKYRLPYLSIPFLFGLWTIFLAARNFEAVGISQKGVYIINEMYAKGGFWLVDVYQWINQVGVPEVIMIYLKSLGAILFQFNILSGIMMAIGLLFYSRIAFSLSFISFASAYYFYQFIGADIDTLSYSYIGFNFILSGIAVGGFFIVPSKKSYLWSIILIPVLVVLTASLTNLFSLFQLAIYSLPFNIVVLTSLYVLKLRTYPKDLEETSLQLYSPEKNLYERSSNAKRYKNYKEVEIGLPVFGEWFISQGRNGAYTHKEEWKDAWDFVIVDTSLQQFKDNGDFKDNYYCFSQPVVAPADGTVEVIIDGVEDNTIGDSNLYQNWGNSVVIKHGYKIYSQLSHLKNGSLKVKKGDTVKKGDVIGQCGNSGRSPYPHLHFQIQKTPFIGSKTLEYPLSSFLTKEKEKLNFHFFDYPKEEKKIKSIDTNKLLTKAFRFIPGRIIKFKVNDGKNEEEVTWEVQSDIYNHSFLYCQQSGSRAFFINDGSLFYFTFFEGNRNSLLYYFFLAAYKIVQGFYHDLEIKDHYPLYLLDNSFERYLHDFVAPFYQFMQSKFHMQYKEIDDELISGKIVIHSKAQVESFGKLKKEMHFEIVIEEDRICAFKVQNKQNKIDAFCIK